MKPVKPNKKEILSELESIRRSLLGEKTTNNKPFFQSKKPASSSKRNIEDAGDVLQNDSSAFDEYDIPILDDLVIDDNSCPDTLEEIVFKLDDAKNSASKVKDLTFHENEAVDLSQVIEDLKQTEAQLLEDLNAPKTSLIEDEVPNKHSAVLPGQQSLFTDNENNSDEESNTHLTKTNPSIQTTERLISPAKTETHTTNVTATYSQKNTTRNNDPRVEKAAQEIFSKKPLAKDQADNPFLPPHIRERLAKQKMVLESDARAQDNALASLKNHVSELSKQSFSTPLYPLGDSLSEKVNIGINDTNNLRLEGEKTNNPAVDSPGFDGSNFEGSIFETSEDQQPLDSYAEKQHNAFSEFSNEEPSLSSQNSLRTEDVIEKLDSSALVSQILSANLDQINEYAIKEPNKENLINELVEKLKPTLEKALREQLNDIL